MRAPPKGYYVNGREHDVIALPSGREALSRFVESDHGKLSLLSSHLPLSINVGIFSTDASSS